MALSDPKNYAVTPKPEPSMAEVLTSMRDLMALAVTQKSDTNSETIAAVLQQLKTMQETVIDKTMPENKFDPGFSVYNKKADGTYYPRGEKPTLRCKTIWCGRELTGDQETGEEIDLLNRLTQGEYRVTKADSTSIPFTVKQKYADSGKLESTEVWFPNTKEHKSDHMPMTSYLRQALGERIPNVQEMLVELERLKRELEIAKTGVMSAV